MRVTASAVGVPAPCLDAPVRCRQRKDCDKISDGWCGTLGGDMGILISGGLVLTLDGSDRLLERQDVLIEDDRIVDIRAHTGAEAATDAETIIDASHGLLMPGLVNAHLHSYDLYMKGLYEGLPLEVWLPYVSLGSRRPLSQREIYVRTARVALEMVRNGITTAHDNTKALPLDEQSIDTMMKAYRDVGLRTAVSVYLTNKPFSECWPYLPEILPDRLKETVDAEVIPPVSDLVDFSREMLSKWNGVDGRLQVALAPAMPQACTDEFILAMHDLACEYDVPLNTHALETKVEVVSGREFYGRSIIEHLHDLGVLTPRMSIDHGVWVSDDDIRLLAQTGASVIHNPVSNLKLKSGIAPIRALLKAGVNVALGCDNNTANDSQNLFDAMKFAALLPQVSGPAIDTWDPARSALRMATAGGAATLLLGEEIGSIEVGKKADIVILDLNTSSLCPLNDPVRQLVYSECGRGVDTVLIDGRIVMQRGQIRTVDEAAILAEVSETADSLKHEHQAANRSAEVVHPFLERMYWKCVSQDVGMTRYSGGSQ